MVIARFQCHHRSATDGTLPCSAQSQYLGVRTPGWLSRPDPGDFVVAVQNHRAHRRVWIGSALDPFGLFDRQPHRGLEVHRRKCLDAAAA